MSESYHSIYLSPHTGDAVISCGGQIAALSRAHRPVLIVTITRATHEERAACKRLGADFAQWDFCDYRHRRHPRTGAPLYPDSRAAFGLLSPVEGALTARIAERLDALPPHTHIVAPLALGRHVDHHLTRVAAERAFGRRLTYFEDCPYVITWLALRRTLQPREDWRALIVRLTPPDIEVSREARLLSEAPGCSEPIRLLAREWRLSRYRQRLGGERLWRRSLDAFRPSLREVVF